MMQLTKWFGLSVMLHLTAICALTTVAGEKRPLPPRMLTVMLDLADAPQLISPRQAAPMKPPNDPPARIPVQATRPGPATAAQIPVTAPQQAPVPTRATIETTQPAAQQTPASEGAVRLGPGQDQKRPQAAAETTQPAQGKPSISQAAGHHRPASNAERGELRPTQEKTQQRYLQENFAYIRDLVVRRLVYPDRARRMNWSGKSVLSFVIAEDGRVDELRVVESSGHRILDQSAMDTVRAAAPFPKPPARAEIVLPIHFKLM